MNRAAKLSLYAALVIALLWSGLTCYRNHQSKIAEQAGAEAAVHAALAQTEDQAGSAAQAQREDLQPQLDAAKKLTARLQVQVTADQAALASLKEQLAHAHETPTPLKDQYIAALETSNASLAQSNQALNSRVEGLEKALVLSDAAGQHWKQAYEQEHLARGADDVAHRAKLKALESEKLRWGIGGALIGGGIDRLATVLAHR